MAGVYLPFLNGEVNMFDNIRNVIANRNFQFGVGGFAILALVAWFATGSQDDETLVTEDASTTTTPVEVTEHDQTPKTESQDEAVKEEADADEKVVDNNQDN